MKAIIGLGNPGREYRGTRHNTGYLTVDMIAEKWGIDMRRRRFHAIVGEGPVAGVRAVLVKPVTFMNNSGVCVRDVMNFFKLPHGELLVICDDIDLPLGSIRIREGGSAGTHNGMRSIVYQLGYDDFPRIRVGIGRADGERGLISHVLGAPSGEDAMLWKQAMEDAADAAQMIMNGRLQEAQAKYNRKGGASKKSKEQETEGNDAGQK